MSDAEQQVVDLLYRCEKLESYIEDLTLQVEDEKAAREQAEIKIRELQSKLPPLTDDDWHLMVRGDPWKP